MLKPERLPRRRYDQFIDLLLGRLSGLFADTPSTRIDRQNTELPDYCHLMESKLDTVFSMVSFSSPSWRWNVS